MNLDCSDCFHVKLFTFPARHNHHGFSGRKRERGSSSSFIKDENKYLFKVFNRKGSKNEPCNQSYPSVFTSR